VAIKTDGTLWAWGINNYGQLGIGEDIDSVWSRNVPVRIGTDSNWKQISAGGNHTMAVKTDGSLWAWGSNLCGQLGDGTTTHRNAPVRVGTDTNWAGGAAGGNHSMVIKTNGTLWGFGQCSAVTGASGNQITAPIRIGTDTNWGGVTAGGSRTTAIKTDGTMWGFNYNLIASDMYIPFITQIGTSPLAGLSGWDMVVTGEKQTMAIKTDGTLWVPGGAVFGAGGRWQITSTQVGTDGGWWLASPGKDHTAAIKTDGTLWVWGSNSYGQLGYVGNSVNAPTKLIQQYTADFTINVDASKNNFWTSTDDRTDGGIVLVAGILIAVIAVLLLVCLFLLRPRK
jgi:alpha-tubulin suppressor-like RCC1 family protein